jgi:MoaA/NifB/PqqE/SkfB family radical SAM enzyme
LSRLILVWRVTERCDTACAFCAYDVRLRRSRRDLDPALALRFGERVASWARGRGRRVLVSWLGGEPFLWAPLAGVSRRLRALGLEIGVTTNGRALAHERWRRFALEDLDELTLSIDGPPAIHDALRRRPGLGAALLEALGDLRERRGDRARPLLRVNSVLMRGNAGAFADLVRTLVAADEITYNALGGADRPEFFAANRLRPEDVEALASLRAPALRGGPGYLAKLSASARDVATPVDDCAPGADFWFIEVDGRLAPCSFTVSAQGVPVDEIDDLDALPRRFASRAPACADCPSTRVHEKFA